VIGFPSDEEPTDWGLAAAIAGLFVLVYLAGLATGHFL
jgi:hypothetical protein